MSIWKSFAMFWYDLIIGDDWKIAVSVVVALGLTGLVLTQTGASDHAVAVVGAVLVVACFTASLVLDVRRKP